MEFRCADREIENRKRVCARQRQEFFRGRIVLNYSPNDYRGRLHSILQSFFSLANNSGQGFNHLLKLLRILVDPLKQASLYALASSGEINC